MRLQYYICSFVLLGIVAEPLRASSDTTGFNGIRSASLGLTGAGVAIGLMDPFGRPGKEGYDTNASLFHPLVSPTQVYRAGGISSINSDISGHGTQTAGVIIAGGSPDGGLYGVAPLAELHAGTTAVGPDPFADLAVAIDNIATRAFGEVRAINLSWGVGLFGFNITDGNSFITQYVDWSAKRT